MPNETILLAQIIKLAEVKSALIFLGDRTAPGLLGVVAQSCGFNWKLHISVADKYVVPPAY